MCLTVRVIHKIACTAFIYLSVTQTIYCTSEATWALPTNCECHLFYKFKFQRSETAFLYSDKRSSLRSNPNAEQYDRPIPWPRNSACNLHKTTTRAKCLSWACVMTCTYPLSFCNLLHAVLCLQAREVPHAIAGQFYDDHMLPLMTPVCNLSFQWRIAVTDKTWQVL